jgi:putative endonuclease
LLILFNLDLQIDNSAKDRVMRIKLYYVYILTNAYNNVLYTGVTNDLERRCYEHKQKIIKGFTQKYNVDKLVYFEKFEFIDLAISREKQIKGYSRTKKITLITNFNKRWQELYQNERVVESTGFKTEIKINTVHI